MIVRLYEAEGVDANSLDLELAWPISEAFETNLIEQEEHPLKIEKLSTHLSLDLKAFEIKTIKLVF